MFRDQQEKQEKHYRKRFSQNFQSYKPSMLSLIFLLLVFCCVFCCCCWLWWWLVGWLVGIVWFVFEGVVFLFFFPYFFFFFFICLFVRTETVKFSAQTEFTSSSCSLHLVKIIEDITINMRKIKPGAWQVIRQEPECFK